MQNSWGASASSVYILRMILGRRRGVCSMRPVR